MDKYRSNRSKNVVRSSTRSRPIKKTTTINIGNRFLSSVPAIPYTENSGITRNEFANDFVFGVGTAAYQHEGSAAKHGKGHSVWDAFTLRAPERIVDGSNGNVAVDMYSKYKEDIKTMKSMGFDAYRFSISWSRILPAGRSCLGVNKEGIDYYNDIINTCLENEIKPYVTLFHWDLPHCLELEYGGFLSDEIIDDFVAYAELCFWEFGDRVKYWFTLNEPWTYSVHGYAGRIFPPGKITASTYNTHSTDDENYKTKDNFIAFRSVDPNLIKPLIRKNNIKTKPKTQADCTDTYAEDKEVYTVARNLLLAHANAVQSYKTKFQYPNGPQKGYIGITLVSHYFYPLDEKDDDDIAAVARALDFMLGWFLDPILYGNYPPNMLDYATDYLDPFSKEESDLLQGSLDFLGLNYYTAYYASNDPNPDTKLPWYKDQQVKFSAERDGTQIGPQGGSSWLYIVPQGIYDLLEYIKNTYGDNIPDIYITENGVDEKNDSKLTAYEACTDATRMKYHQDHLAKIRDAIMDFGDDISIKGYFLWSWCDNFEWVEGYSVRFGIIYIDYMNNLTRYPKHSAKWFVQFLTRKHLLK